MPSVRAGLTVILAGRRDAARIEGRAARTCGRETHPVPQARIADAKVPGDLGDRRAALTGKLDRTLPELWGGALGA